MAIRNSEPNPKLLRLTNDESINKNNISIPVFKVDSTIPPACGLKSSTQFRYNINGENSPLPLCRKGAFYGLVNETEKGGRLRRRPETQTPGAGRIAMTDTGKRQVSARKASLRNRRNCLRCPVSGFSLVPQDGTRSEHRPTIHMRGTGNKRYVNYEKQTHFIGLCWVA